MYNHWSIFVRISNEDVIKMNYNEDDTRYYGDKNKEHIVRSDMFWKCVNQGSEKFLSFIEINLGSIFTWTYEYDEYAFIDMIDLSRVPIYNFATFFNSLGSVLDVDIKEDTLKIVYYEISTPHNILYSKYEEYGEPDTVSLLFRDVKTTLIEELKEDKFTNRTLTMYLISLNITEINEYLAEFERNNGGSIRIDMFSDINDITIAFFEGDTERIQSLMSNGFCGWDLIYGIYEKAPAQKELDLFMDSMIDEVSLYEITIADDVQNLRTRIGMDLIKETSAGDFFDDIFEYIYGEICEGKIVSNTSKSDGVKYNPTTHGELKYMIAGHTHPKEIRDSRFVYTMFGYGCEHLASVWSYLKELRTEKYKILDTHEFTRLVEKFGNLNFKHGESIDMEYMRGELLVVSNATLYFYSEI